jgi:hypothetical protein
MSRQSFVNELNQTQFAPQARAYLQRLSCLDGVGLLGRGARPDRLRVARELLKHESLHRNSKDWIGS